MPIAVAPSNFSGVRSYWLLMGAMAAVFLALFFAVAALDVSLLTDPGPLLARAGRAEAAVLGVTLLVIDVFLPVPSSLVMIGHGALFGLVPGTLVSLVGGSGAAALGFGIGRWGRGVVHRFVPEGDRRRADELLRRGGPLAVVVSRPVPILAETVAILAGTSSLGWVRFLTAAVAGTIPAALLYAATGATAARLDNALLIFGLVIFVAGLVWVIGRRTRPGTGRV